MAKKYNTPVFLGSVDGIIEDWSYTINSQREMKDDISTSFVYGDDNYEEEYVVPDVVEEILPVETGTEELAE